MKISIITVVFNNRDFIEDCINSVLSQNHDDLEYIIIDGGSSDGTLQKINEHANKISKIISEPDNGIYDAMNKGIALATGEVIGILNADDFYTSTDVLSLVNKVFSDSSIGACYSDVEYVRRENVRRVVRRWHSGVFDRNRFFYGWSPPHPTFFARRALFKKFGGYNTSLKISADYEMMLRLLFVNQVKCHYLSKIIIRMREGGISNRSVLNRLRANKEDRMAWEINLIRPRPYTLSLKPLRKLAQFF